MADYDHPEEDYYKAMDEAERIQAMAEDAREERVPSAMETFQMLAKKEAGPFQEEQLIPAFSDACANDDHEGCKLLPGDVLVPGPNKVGYICPCDCHNDGEKADKVAGEVRRKTIDEISKAVNGLAKFAQYNDRNPLPLHEIDDVLNALGLRIRMLHMERRQEERGMGFVPYEEVVIRMAILPGHERTSMPPMILRAADEMPRFRMNINADWNPEK